MLKSRNIADNKVVIRHSLLGNILLAICCAVFVAMGIFLLQLDTLERIIGIAAIVFFGGGGVAYFLLMSWKPVAIISNTGITVPYGWGRNFVPWENVVKFEIVVQNIGVSKQKYIGIFVADTTGIVGAGKFSQSLTKDITGWAEAPAMLINPSFTFLKIEKIMQILQTFYDEYKKAALPH